MPKISSRISLVSVLLPFTLCSTLAQIGQAAENNTLHALVAGILEREGVIESGTAPSTRAAQLQANPTRDTNAFAASTALALEDDTAATQADAPLVLGVALVFADAEAKALSRQNLAPPDALLDALERATEVPLHFKRAMSMDAFVFEFEQPLSWEAFKALQQQLQSLAIIETLYPDLYQAPKRVPGASPFYYYQWSLLPTDMYSDSLESTVVGLNAEGAWELTTGSSDMTVAVIDTGLTDPHPFKSWRVLPGYDFITNPDYARDDDGRDADPTDMGDHRLEDECEYFPEASNSSWHGTGIASVIAANGNDSKGIAGVNWRANLLPVRVLGKCGANDSDIIDGMMWAAGLPVPGVPDNQNPAQVLNISLGSVGESPMNRSCPPMYRAALSKLRTQNILIIAAAGNEDTDAAQHSPSHCNGMLAVSAVDHLGERASYSNWSTEGKIFIAAPGGDPKHGPWSGILTTLDEGDTEPTGELAQYFTGGTSMSAALVSGVASLAWGLDPDQRPDVIAAILRETVQPFASDSRCEEEWPLCGPGIVDARAAVRGVQAMKPYSSVVEFYHPGLEHYFSTANSDEVALVRAGNFGAWLETGQGFLGWRKQSEPGVLPVCRFYGTPGIGPNSHFYTVDPEECEQVKQDRGWTYEGVPFYAKKMTLSYCPRDSVAVYRYYNNGWTRNDSNHRYATHLNDRAAMEADGWVLEGTAMCVPGQPR